jgi:hypothetical protein
MRRLTTFDELVAFVTENKLPHKLDREGRVLELPSNDETVPGDLHMRWEAHLPFVTLIQFVIMDVPAARIADVERAIVILNNKLDFGTFGMDEPSRRLYHRVTVPVHEGIEPTVLNQFGFGCVKQARQYAPAFRAVVDGKPGADILAIAERTLAEQGGGAIALTAP